MKMQRIMRKYRVNVHTIGEKEVIRLSGLCKTRSEGLPKCRMYQICIRGWLFCGDTSIRDRTKAKALYFSQTKSKEEASIVEQNLLQHIIADMSDILPICIK